MRFTLHALIGLVLLFFSGLAAAEKLLESSSLNSCMEKSRLSATFFRFAYTPSNHSIFVQINGLSDISGKVMLEFKVFAYGHDIMTTTVDPASNEQLAGLDPMHPGPLDIRFKTPMPSKYAGDIPGIAYSVPDLDGRVQIYINDKETGKPLACVETDLSNGHTVHQKAVGWVTAIIAGLGLAGSAIASGFGHSKTAAHLAANAMSLFGFFQAQAFVGMCAVRMPPIVAAWTQNFQWSMGIIRVAFLQRMCTWFQRATGGTPDELLKRLSVTSVRVQRRALEMGASLLRRTNAEASTANSREVVIVRGIERVGFKAGIEKTNIFMTGYTFFLIFVFLVIVGVVAFKFICEGLAKMGRMRNNKFREFRAGWSIILRGILFRIVLLGFPQMVVLCFWETISQDSSAEIVLAVFTIVIMIGLLVFSLIKVKIISKRPTGADQSPIYTLYSDPETLNKWGFLYVQYKGKFYYFVGCTLIYIFLKGLFIAFAQGSGKVQAVALLIIEGAYLVILSVFRPFMDGKTNGFNIAIAAVNFLNAIFLLFFSEIFGQPEKIGSVMGLVYFFINVIFAAVLLVMVLGASIMGVFSKNPDNRYKEMSDDRTSFMPNLGGPTQELVELARGVKGSYVHPVGNDATQPSILAENPSSSRLGPDQAMYAMNSPSPNPYSNGTSTPSSNYQPLYNHSPRPSSVNWGEEGRRT